MDQGLLKIVGLLWVFSVGASIAAVVRKLSRVTVTEPKQEQHQARRLR